MEFRLLSDVRQVDAGELGELRRVIVDPTTRRVSSIVVKSNGLDGRAVVVPIERVVASDEDGVYLDTSPKELETFSAYAYGRNLAPPPAEYDDEVESAGIDEELVDAPDVSPVGAAAGITSIAYTPIIEVERTIPDGFRSVNDETTVEATDGEAGHLRHVLIDDSSRIITAIRYRKGRVFTTDIEVPSAAISGIEDERITLSISTAQAAGSEDGP